MSSPLTLALVDALVTDDALEPAGILSRRRRSRELLAASLSNWRCCNRLAKSACSPGSRLPFDGTKVTSAGGGVSGQSVWIDVPGHGRFVFSLAARTDLGMQRSGEIRGNTMTWQANGHDYKIETDKPIASGSRAYNLYVFHLPRTAEYFGMSAGPSPEPPIRNR
jgi:hypothetical protein